MLELVVTSPFGGYATGSVITDPVLMATILAGPDRSCVVEVNVPGSGGAPAEKLTLGIVSAVALQPMLLAGEVDGATPSGLDYSVDGGTTWAPVARFVLGGDSWTGVGPTFSGARSGAIVVRDHATGVASAPVGFAIGPVGGGPLVSGTLTLGDGSVIDAIGPGLLAPQTGAVSAGALSVAFGTLTGMVADGGMLAAEATSRAAGDTAGLTALATETTARQAGEAASSSALASEATARASGDTAGLTALTTETTARQAGDAAAASALSTETAARASGDTAGLAAASAAQATANAALPAARLGVAGGAASLDGTARVPAANLPSPAGLGWTDVAGTAAIFHRGPVPTPPAARAGLLLADRAKLAGDFNFAEVWDTQANFDAWPALQNFLL